MVNHIYDEKADATLCGDYRGPLAYAVSGHRHSCPSCLDIASTQRISVWRTDTGHWAWRCPCCSGQYIFGGGGVNWWATMYAAESHIQTVHKPTA